MASIFKGPHFYSEEESSIFKGRDNETIDLLYIVEHSDFSVCYAISGEGKSSLINAGLCPKLRKDGFLPIYITNIAEAKIGHFDEFVLEKIDESINEERKKDLYSGLSIFRTEPEPENKDLSNSVWWKLRTCEFRINSFETVTPILIFDQFEEVFGSVNELSWTDAFFSWLEQLYQDIDPLAGEYSGKLQKKFKILFSLRSEYVCELDYWSMNKYYIPSLKNNRYYLKPLTKGAALEIASLLDQLPTGLNKEDIIRHAKVERVGEWESIKDDLPCVSALILSLVLTGLYEKDVEVETKIESISVSSSKDRGKELFDFLLDNIYEKALDECDAANNKTVKDFIETLEDTLIDVNGRRRHVSERELPQINDEKVKDALNVLEKRRIINFIDLHYEISHDSLCSIINKRKELRHAEKERRKLQKIAEEAEIAKKEAAEKLDKEKRKSYRWNTYVKMLLFMIFLVCAVYYDSDWYFTTVNDHPIVTFYSDSTCAIEKPIFLDDSICHIMDTIDNRKITLGENVRKVFMTKKSKVSGVEVLRKNKSDTIPRIFYIPYKGIIQIDTISFEKESFQVSEMGYFKTLSLWIKNTSKSFFQEQVQSNGLWLVCIVSLLMVAVGIVVVLFLSRKNMNWIDISVSIVYFVLLFTAFWIMELIEHLFDIDNLTIFYPFIKTLLVLIVTFLLNKIIKYTVNIILLVYQRLLFSLACSAWVFALIELYETLNILFPNERILISMIVLPLILIGIYFVFLVIRTLFSISKCGIKETKDQIEQYDIMDAFKMMFYIELIFFVYEIICLLLSILLSSTEIGVITIIPAIIALISVMIVYVLFRKRINQYICVLFNTK